MRRRRGIGYEAEVEEQGGRRPRVLRCHGTQDQHRRPRLLYRGGHRVRRRHGHRRLVRFLGEDRVSECVSEGGREGGRGESDRLLSWTWAGIQWNHNCIYYLKIYDLVVSYSLIYEYFGSLDMS